MECSEACPVDQILGVNLRSAEAIPQLEQTETNQLVATKTAIGYSKSLPLPGSLVRQQDPIQKKEVLGQQGLSYFRIRFEYCD